MNGTEDDSSAAMAAPSTAFDHLRAVGALKTTPKIHG